MKELQLLIIHVVDLNGRVLLYNVLACCGLPGAVRLMLDLIVFVVRVLCISVFQPLGSQHRSTIYETLFSTPDETPFVRRWW